MLSDEQKLLHERRIKHDEAAEQLLLSTIKSLFLVNGGALVAILALIGAVAQAGRPIPESIADVMTHFVWGLLAALSASFFSWGTMDLFSSQAGALLKGESDKALDNLSTATTLLTFASLIVGFGCAAWAFSESVEAVRELSLAIEASQQNPS